MYEDVTYEIILQRKLDRVSGNNDKREGSIIYDALAPTAIETQLIYIELDALLNECFADTASREFLVRRAKERGLTPEQATCAILKGKFTPAALNIAIGERFSCGGLNYAVVEKLDDGMYKMQCETSGTGGNTTFGTLIPIEYVQGLETAELTELLIPGEAEEDTEAFRKRYLNSFNLVAFGGNKADYIAKTNAIPGVGGTKVYPVWNGGGTVKLVIINSSFDAPSSTLVETVQDTIDPVLSSGMGNGLAPIDHRVTVVGVEEITIDVAIKITYQGDWVWADIESSVQAVIDEYLLSLRQSWADEENLIVRISQIESRLLNVTGILDVADTTVNGETKNLVLGADCIPVRGSCSGT